MNGRPRDPTGMPNATNAFGIPEFKDMLHENMRIQNERAMTVVELTVQARTTALVIENIPAELREQARWVCWRYEERGGKPTKIPIDPGLGRNASSTDATTWTTFDVALTRFQADESLAGIGYVFAQDAGEAGVDIDDCIDPATGVIKPWAAELILLLDTYAEISPSGEGVKLWTRGQKREGWKSRVPFADGEVELYDHGRYFTVTGRRLEGSPATVNERQAQLDELQARMVAAHTAARGEACQATPAPQAQPAPAQASPCGQTSLTTSESALLEHAFGAANGSNLELLWRGEWQAAGYTSQSEADAALLSALRFWTGGNKAQALAMFAQSGLVREKWQREDYRERTWAAVNHGDVFGSRATPASTSPAPAVPVLAEPVIAVPICGHSLADFRGMQIDHGETLLGARALCRGGGMLTVAPSGVGKSSAGVQQDVLWALGRPAFGIPPARPLRIACIQSENDDGDMHEMAFGVIEGLALTQAEIDVVRANTLYVSARTVAAGNFIRLAERVLEEFHPDLLRIDPLQGFLGGDPKDTKAILDFCQGGLNPLLERYGCAVVVHHHTPKTSYQDKSDWKHHDWMYAGAGAAALTNWARAILVIDPHPEDPHLFKFIAAKRGMRFGWRDAEGDPEFVRWFRHSRQAGLIYWEEARPGEVTAASTKPAGKTVDDLLALVPATGSVIKGALISQARRVGIAERKARGFIDELVNSGQLEEQKVKRPEKRDEIRVARRGVGVVVGGCQ